MYRNCTRTGFEVHACTASLPHVRKKYLFHKLIHVIRIFMRKISWFTAIHEKHRIISELRYIHTMLLHSLIFTLSPR